MIRVSHYYAGNLNTGKVVSKIVVSFGSNGGINETVLDKLLDRVGWENAVWAVYGKVSMRNRADFAGYMQHRRLNGAVE